MAARSLDWPIETIPDDDFLYRRVHTSLLDASDLDFIPPAAFRAINDEVSVEWAKYTLVNAKLLRARDPRVNGLIEIKASHIRCIDFLDVIHAPLPQLSTFQHHRFSRLPKSKIDKASAPIIDESHVDSQAWISTRRADLS